MAGVPEFQRLYDEVASCGKCGFCLPTCPVYRATFHEGHVARGKNALMRNLIEGDTAMTPDLQDAFSNCLLCRACTANCFPAVKTDRLVIGFREAYGRRFGRSLAQRAVIRGLLPRPGLMRPLVRATWSLRRTRLVGASRRLGLVGVLNAKLERALDMRDEAPGRLLRDRLRDRRAGISTGRRGGSAAASTPATAAPGAGRERSTAVVRPAGGLRVGYWMSCGYNYVLPEVGEATVRVLENLGARVEVLDNCCCGLAAYGYGDLDGARSLARINLELLGDLSRFDVVVSECGSCSGHLKEYPELLDDDPEFSRRAVRLVEKVRSFSEFVVKVGGAEHLRNGTGLAAAVTYHDPCHLGSRYQGVVAQPRELLQAVPGVTFRELTEADSCCGAAGTYGLLHPETSAAIIDRKMGHVRRTGAAILATECPSCMLQLRLGVRRAGLDVTVLNVSQVCDLALGDG
jgi:glycolate oxidase iron-sulfur subunit